MAKRTRARGEIKDARGHNLKVLNPDRQRPTLAPSLTEAEREHGLRFILQTAEASTPARLEEAIWARHGLLVDVKPLFPGVDPAADANGMDRFFLATLPGLARRDIEDDVFDLGYTLAQDTPAAGFLSVEPDLPHAVFHGIPELAIVPDINVCTVGAAKPVDRAWHVRAMRVPQAWMLTPPTGGDRFGRGSKVGHIDTGWAVHDDFEHMNVDLNQGFDFVDDDDDPHDPLERGSILGGFLTSAGHGTATSSVIVGRGDGSATLQLPPLAQLELWGVAPRATLVPIRAIRFVFFLYDGDVAPAIQFAADQGCHVISMSLGGIPTMAVEAAVNYAVARNVIVCAAAGNCFQDVRVAPAIYPNCIAVAGCNGDDGPWQFSSRGAAVAVTAPAENVWASRREPDDTVTNVRDASEGTSFAVANVAGVAALWLAFHGRETLLERYRDRAVLHHVFRHLLQQTARPSPLLPAGQFGSGIVDAHALLAEALPDAAAVDGPATLADFQALSQPEVIAAMFGAADPSVVRAELATQLGGDAQIAAAGVSAVDDQAHIWGPELIHILAQDQAAYMQFASALTAREHAGLATPAVTVSAPDGQLTRDLSRQASRGLRAALGA